MDFRFSADEWCKLPPADRIRRCRLMAHEAELMAHEADMLAGRSASRMKALYLQLAIQWKLLAEEMEIGKPKPP